MAPVSLRLGDLVWGKLGPYPPWPAKIITAPKSLRKPRGKKYYFVKFFGMEDHAWMETKQLKPYHAHKEEIIKVHKGKLFRRAVNDVEEYLRTATEEKQTPSHNSAEDKNRDNSSGERSQPDSCDKKCERCLSLSEGKLKNMGEGKETVSSGSSESSEGGSKSPPKRAQPQGSQKHRQSPKNFAVPESRTMKETAAGPVASLKGQWTASGEPASADPHFDHFLLSQIRKATGSVSIQAADSGVMNGSIIPTDKKIGFLGLTLMGNGMVSNLLKTGHKVTVWNPTTEKEEACLGRTPAEVVSSCDITFAYAPDSEAAKDLVLRPGGVLQGICPGKCYVDLSTVDADTVTELAQVIVSRGGRFLEAPVLRNQQLSNDGMLVILAAGDKGLYEDCSSCFQAMGKTFFLGEVGSAAKMMLIVNMVQGSFMATIAEGLTLAQETGQSPQTFLDIFNQGKLASIFLDPKCQNFLQGNFKPDFHMKYIVKDLHSAIALGNAINHPTTMATAASEVYKRAEALSQADSGMSALSQAYMH
ncbi:cytokine-like nuclear factor N-PAC isoform X2 [Artibeus jamaicensis]|uniref:cytokine-like nuclear factor N-PAC isoform X2 n=1 Tax=Artibeus jamaicensis TaxID=9417 RepID=UPI00235AD15D|nr:cytokine-like nuclear factor N-PAC isoform X2 [Artibeus jamaicensis]